MYAAYYTMYMCMCIYVCFSNLLLNLDNKILCLFYTCSYYAIQIMFKRGLKSKKKFIAYYFKYL